MTKGKNLKWSLMDDGDLFEKAYWPYLKDSFPNYEVFWNLFIVPLTRRIIDRTNILFRADIDPLLEETSMAHYTIFKSLYFIFEEKKCFGNESLRNVYYHFGLIIEMVNLLTWKVYSIKCRVGLENQEFIPALKENEATKKFRSFMKDNYHKQYQDFIGEGRPVVYYLHTRTDVLNKLIKDPNFLKKVKDFFRGISDYRNSFIHTPLPGHLVMHNPFTKKATRFVIKKDKIRQYKLWTDVTHTFQVNIDDFIAEEQLVEKDFYKIQEILNEIWGHLIIEINGIMKQAKYRGLAKL